MESLISNIIPPLPDELLYSWVIRLAKVNGMPPLLFYRTYFQNGDSKCKAIPTDIKSGFLNFLNAIQYDNAPHKLYFGLTTMSLDLSALTQKNQNDIIIKFFNDEDTHFGIFIPKGKTFNMCPECAKEDVAQYGEMYIHRSHNISGVKVCHKHHEPLHIIENKSNGIYSLCSGTHKMFRSFEQECEYSEFAHYLLKNRFQSNIDNIANILYAKMPQEYERSKSFIAGQCFANLGIGSTLTAKKGSDDDPFNANEIIFLLQNYYKNPVDVINIANPYKIAVDKKCKGCGRYYYVNNDMKDEISCPYCNTRSN